MANPLPIKADRLFYIRIPDGHGARAEMVRMTYVLAGKSWEDVFTTFADARATVTGKNPYKQFPFVETADGRIVYQTIAIMHHAASGTSAWPSKPEDLTRALMVAMGAYDLYQAFGGFAADDAAAKKKFEERRAPQYMGALEEIYAKTAGGVTGFAIGDTPTFADCIAHESVAWVLRRNDVCKKIYADSPALQKFIERFRAIPEIHAFMEKQAAARVTDASI